MAIVRSLAIGKAINSAGNITFSTVKGRTIAREKPAFVRNPDTPAQQAQRQKMRNAVAFYRWFGIAIKFLFTQTTKYGSQYNEFIRRNMELAPSFTVDEDTGSVVPVSGAVVSAGVYPYASLFWGVDGDGALSVKIDNEQLRQEIALGDQFVFIGYKEDGTYEVRSLSPTEEEILQLKDGESVLLGAVDEGKFNALAWYSSARNRSSTAVLGV